MEPVGPTSGDRQEVTGRGGASRSPVFPLGQCQRWVVPHYPLGVARWSLLANDLGMNIQVILFFFFFFVQILNTASAVLW